MTQGKTQYDYIDIIGETHFTTNNYVDKVWNQYYFKSYSYVVDKMLGDVSGKSVIDVGTSHGSWFDFLKSKQFGSIYGVEIDPERAALAKECGYTAVYNCDAAEVPIENSSVDYAVSNDVFVHILKLDDKIAVLKKIEDILKPNGVFILNHTMSKAFNYTGYTVEKYCSFLDLDEFIRMVMNHTQFEIVDIKPTYYFFRHRRLNPFNRVLRSAIVRIPLGYYVLFLMDYLYSRKLGMQESDVVYLKLRKK